MLSRAKGLVASQSALHTGAAVEMVIARGCIPSVLGTAGLIRQKDAG